MGSIGLVTKKVTLKLSLKSILKCMWKGLFSKIENFNFSKNLLFLWSPHYYYYYCYCPLYLGKSLLRPYLCLTFYSLVNINWSWRKIRAQSKIEKREKKGIEHHLLHQVTLTLASLFFTVASNVKFWARWDAHRMFDFLLFVIVVFFFVFFFQSNNIRVIDFGSLKTNNIHFLFL